MKLTKNKALNYYGSKVVEKARDLYETDSGKVLFTEDCKCEDDRPADPETIKEYLGKAYGIMSREYQLK
jgi:hypothetical protein